MMNIDEILNYLPHRPPFLFIDKIVDIKPGKSIVAIKNVTANEPFFEGHFPEYPIMPGVLIIEALAQASTVLAFKSTDETPKQNRSLYFLAGVDKAKFKKVVLPGDQLRLEVELIKARKTIWKLKGIAKVDGKIVCSAEFTSARKKNEKEKND